MEGYITAKERTRNTRIKKGYIKEENVGLSRKEYKKKWNKDNTSHNKEYQKKWREKNKDYHKKWLENHPGYMEKYYQMKKKKE